MRLDLIVAVATDLVVSTHSPLDPENARTRRTRRDVVIINETQISVDVGNGGVGVHHIRLAVLGDAKGDVLVVARQSRELNGDGRREDGPRDEESGVEHLAVGKTVNEELSTLE